MLPTHHIKLRHDLSLRISYIQGDLVGLRTRRFPSFIFRISTASKDHSPNGLIDTRADEILYKQNIGGHCSAIAALTILENYSVDLVVSDILMPNLNGYAFTEHIRAKYAVFDHS